MAANLEKMPRLARNATVRGVTMDRGKPVSPRVAISFDPDMFQQIEQRAQAAGVPFARFVRSLVAVGLQSEPAQ